MTSRPVAITPTVFQPFLQGGAVGGNVDAVGQAAHDKRTVGGNSFNDSLGLLAAVVGGLAGAYQGQRFGVVEVGCALVIEEGRGIG